MRRCRRDTPRSDPRQVRQAFDMVWELLGNGEMRRTIANWHQRAIMLFVEVIAVGVYARALHQETPLSRADLQVFADWLKRILNDWVED